MAKRICPRHFSQRFEGHSNNSGAKLRHNCRATGEQSSITTDQQLKERVRVVVVLCCLSCRVCRSAIEVRETCWIRRCAQLRTVSRAAHYPRFSLHPAENKAVAVSVTYSILARRDNDNDNDTQRSTSHYCHWPGLTGVSQGVMTNEATDNTETKSSFQAFRGGRSRQDSKANTSCSARRKAMAQGRRNVYGADASP